MRGHTLGQSSQGEIVGFNRSHGSRSLTLGKYEDASPFWGQTAVTGGRHFNTGPRTPRQVQKEQCDKTDYEHNAKSQGRYGRRRRPTRIHR